MRCSISLREAGGDPRRIAIFAGLALVIASGASSPAAAREPAGRLDAELAQIVALLPGRYQGTMPVMSDPSAKKTETVYHKIARIDAPQFGAVVMYHQIGAVSPDGPPAQQKIYVFDVSPSRTENRMRSFVIPRGRGLQNLESLGPELAPDSLMNFPPECAIRWRRVSGGFAAHVSARDCQYPSQTWKTDVRPDVTYVLKQRSFSLQESMYYADGRPMFEMKRPSVARRLD